MKVLLNKCYGGFGVSSQGYLLYAKKKGLPLCAYKHNPDTGLCERVSIENNGDFGVHYFLKDFGDSFKPEPQDWEHKVHFDEASREDPILVEVVEELGDSASDTYSALVVVDIPDDMHYTIDYYDGYEELHESVPTW